MMRAVLLAIGHGTGLRGVMEDALTRLEAAGATLVDFIFLPYKKRLVEIQLLFG